VALLAIWKIFREKPFYFLPRKISWGRNFSNWAHFGKGGIARKGLFFGREGLINLDLPG